MSDRIKISREFKDNILGSLWLGLERDIEPESDISESFRIANQELCHAYENLFNVDMGRIGSNNATSVNGMEPRKCVESYLPITNELYYGEKPTDKIESFIATINYCSSLKFLENFKKRVDEENDDRLTVAYNKKHSELLNKQS